MKRLQDIFGKIIDENSSISDLLVEDIKYSQKTSTAICNILVEKKINPLELYGFVMRANEEYQVKDFKIKLKCPTAIEIQPVDVENVVSYIKAGLPYLNDLFVPQNIEIDNGQVSICVGQGMPSFLKIKKIDEQISATIKNVFNQETKVEFFSKDEKTIKDIKPAYVKIEEVTVKNEQVKSEKTTTKPTSKKRFDAKTRALTEGIKSDDEHVIMGKDISKVKVYPIEELNTEYDKPCVEGKIESLEVRETKSGKMLLMMDVGDSTSTITCKSFFSKEQYNSVADRFKEGNYVRVVGRYTYDTFSKENVIMLESVNDIEAPPKRKDNASEKRVELHMHTQMSAMDGVSSCTDIVKQAIKWGHKAVAITDHGVLQAFPEANSAAMNKETGEPDIKVIYGVEGYLIEDVEPSLNHGDKYVVFDIETTGLYPEHDSITEIGAVKISKGKITEQFSTFVNPERPIPMKIQELTHITNDMVKNAPTIKQALKDFLKFCEGCVIVAHNAKFDTSFIQYACEQQKMISPKYIIDTLTVARELFETYENHKLGTIATNLGVILEDAHRAINDAQATAKVFLKMSEILLSKNMNIDNYIQSSFIEDNKQSPYHIIILAKDYEGLKNLYKLVSFSHLRYFYKKPRISRAMLNRYRRGLIIGSACERGELYQAILNKEDESKIESIAKYYDYLEVQPIGNNMFYVEQGILDSVESVQNINKEIINLGDKLNIPVVATCDVHFINPQDEIYRRILMAGQGYEDADNQAPLFFRTTDEMLEEFSYISKEKAKEIVIDNTNKIAEMVMYIKPVVSGTYYPVIEGSDKIITDMTYNKAHEIYGENLPEIVQKRIEKELKPIIDNGFSVMYMIAQQLVKKSNDDGYLVGSRGSVGSSFVATMVGITEVNPLPPHYICETCKHVEFPNVAVTTGVDMEEKDCPNCKKTMIKQGMDIPFETFLGFKGDKVPDIDLNFSSEYQSKAHAYTEVLFGKYKTFRAGTIGTIETQTAYGFVKKYYEAKNKTISMAQVNKLSKGCTGVKRTTGQHPGGIIVVPHDKEIYDFTPVQHPADDPKSRIITTHFDFHSIHDNLLKLDILGHADPTAIRMLEDLTGIDARAIPLDEPKVMSLFTSTKALDVTPEQINSPVGTFAVPEFGTNFVRQMLLDTKPTTFGELVRISGLSHGTDVWNGNAQTLIENNTVTLKEAICTRDDIMLYLIQMGVEPSVAFKIMEIVRKGKAKKLLTDEHKKAMKEANVPDWYIESCLKIQYMFPKAHACAYVMMAYRIAYFKVYYPKEFYATFYSVRAGAGFDYDLCGFGLKKVKDAISTYKGIPSPTMTEKDVLTVLEVVNEMLERKISFLPIDLYLSDSTVFKVEADGVRPPLSAIPGFGTVNALNVIEARKQGKFESKESLGNRAKLGKTALELLNKYGVTKGLPASSQLCLFDDK